MSSIHAGPAFSSNPIRALHLPVRVASSSATATPIENSECRTYFDWNGPFEGRNLSLYYNYVRQF